SGELTLTEIAARADLPLSTAHRLVEEWVRWGGLTRGADGRYRIGMRFWRLGVRAPTARRLRTTALPYLEDLYELTHEHVHLAILDRGAALYLERFSGRDAVRVISDVGTRLPLHATGVGLMLLAHAPEGTLDALLASDPKQYLPNTMTAGPELSARIADVRKDGLAVSLNEMTVDTFSVAAPVRDGSGAVVAAVSVVGHADRASDPRIPIAVRAAGFGISRALGWKG
ncbi:MAG: IclR family transcriptional regulator, partial [Actinomycetota bacterium]|nr:IclR family transcriptional regulator [Actinomycetota bacterium]